MLSAFQVLEQLTHVVVVQSWHFPHTPRTHPEGFGGCQFASYQQPAPQNIIQDLLEVTGPLSAHLSFQFCSDIIIDRYGSSHTQDGICVGIMMSIATHIDNISRIAPKCAKKHYYRKPSSVAKLGFSLEDFQEKFEGKGSWGDLYCDQCWFVVISL